MKRNSFTFKYNVAPSLRKTAKSSKNNLPTYPYLPVRFYYKEKTTPVIETLLDSGSDRIYIHKAIAEDLDLPILKKVTCSGMGGKYMSYETKVGLIIGRGGKETDLGIVDATVPEENQDVPFLIGRFPIFNEYQVIFEDYKQRFKLIPKEEILTKEKKTKKKKWGK